MDNPQGKPTQAKGENKETKINLTHIEAGIDALANEVKFINQRSKNDKWPKRTGKAALVYTGMTFVILLITGYQAYLSRQALVAVQRAFVVAEVPVVHSISISNEMKWRIRPSWHNSGTTPALRAILAFQCAYTKSISPEAISSYPKDSILENNVISPQNTSATGGVTLEQTSVNDIIAKKLRMFCYGLSAYRDVFSIKRTTKFCFEFLGFESGAPGVLTAGIWGTCPWRYACTDDQCKSNH